MLRYAQTLHTIYCANFSEKLVNQQSQLLNYLQATGIKIGLLVNFKNQKAEIKRMVLNLPEGHDSFSSVKSTDENVRVCQRKSAAK